MYCPHCQTELVEDAVFCKKCGKRIKADTLPVSVSETQPVQSYYEQKEALRQNEVSALNGLIQYFSQKQDVYDRYDTSCAWINRLSRGSSNALLIWGGIVIGIFFFILALYLPEAYDLQNAVFDLFIIALFSLVPGIAMIGGGIAKKIHHRNLTYRYLYQYVELSKELHQHYLSYPNCPIVPECTNPRIIIKVQHAIAAGRCDNIKQGINNVFAASNHTGIAQYQEVTMRNTSDINWKNGLKFIFLPPRFFR